MLFQKAVLESIALNRPFDFITTDSPYVTKIVTFYPPVIPVEDYNAVADVYTYCLTFKSYHHALRYIMGFWKGNPWYKDNLQYFGMYIRGFTTQWQALGKSIELVKCKTSAVHELGSRNFHEDFLMNIGYCLEEIGFDN